MLKVLMLGVDRSVDMRALGVQCVDGCWVQGGSEFRNMVGIKVRVQGVESGSRVWTQYCCASA